MTAPIGVLVMAYGTASGPEDIERYYTDIRGGRAPSPEHLAELKERYAAIGNVFPLLDTTRAQADGLVSRLNGGETSFRAYLGMKHSPPAIPEAVAQMRDEGVERAVGIVMAPHWSGMSVETYVERVRSAVAESGDGPRFSFVRSYHAHPSFVRLLAGRVSDALERVPSGDRAGTHVLFTAHSLPTRAEEDGSLRCKTCDCADSCRYRDGLQETADLVAGKLGLESYGIAWQSAGRTADPWWGPPVEEAIREVAAKGHPAVVVCSAGFVADHLEILVRPRHRGEGDRGGRGDPLRTDRDAERRPRLPGRPRRRDRGTPRRGSGPVTDRVAVVGGGIAGLATAFHLQRAGVESLVFERAATHGGVIAPPVTVGDLALEPGPDSLAARKPWGAALCRELGLTLIPPGASGALLWTDAGLVPYLAGTAFGIPGDVGDVLRWPGLSRRRSLPCAGGSGQAETARRGRGDAGCVAPPPARRRGDRPGDRAAPGRSPRGRRRRALGAGDLPRARGVGGIAGEPDPWRAGGPTLGRPRRSRSAVPPATPRHAGAGRRARRCARRPAAHRRRGDRRQQHRGPPRRPWIGAGGRGGPRVRRAGDGLGPGINRPREGSRRCAPCPPGSCSSCTRRGRRARFRTAPASSSHGGGRR